MRVLLAILLFLPLASAQIVPIYHTVPDPQEYAAGDIPEPVLFADLGVAMENLLFHNGTMYVTAFADGLWQVLPDGSFEQIFADPPAPGLTPLDQGAHMMSSAVIDGELYVSQGSSILTPVEARVLRFAEPGSPDYTVFADGFDGANGLAADPDGNLYLAHGFREGVYKILPDGSWDLWATLPTANGLSLHPDATRLVYASVWDFGTSVNTVSLADADDRHTLFTFNLVDPIGPGVNPDAAVLPKTIDDPLVHPDGRVFVPAHERLEILMGDPATGEACILKDDLADAPTSVRMAEGFGDWDGWVFSTDNAGEIWAMDVRGDVPEPPVSPSEPEPQAEAPSNDSSLGMLSAIAALAVATTLVARRR